MGYTGKQIFDMAIAIIDELSETGVVSESKTKEYMNRAPFLLDMFQKEIGRRADLYKTFEVSLTKKKNLLGDSQYGTIIENNGEENKYSAKGANNFYVEVDGDCTITFTEDGQLLSGAYSFNGGPETEFVGIINITVPKGTTSFLPVRGILHTSSPTATVTMKISGQYYFRHNNRGMGVYKYKSALQVPDFREWVKITMPDDFKAYTQIVNDCKPWHYITSSYHRWENNRDLYVHHTYEGVIRIHYIPVPERITSLDQTLEIDDVAAMAGAYYLAQHFAISDMLPDLAKMCADKYIELKAESKIRQPISSVEIIDVYDFGEW